MDDVISVLNILFPDVLKQVETFLSLSVMLDFSVILQAQKNTLIFK